MIAQRLVKAVSSAFGTAKHSKAAGLALIGSAILLVLQSYFLRELLAAELLFGFILIPVLTIVGIIYAIGQFSDYGSQAIAVRVHAPPRLKDRRGL